jgi:hypothetical protein
MWARHRFNAKFWKTRERKPETEVVEMAVPPIIDPAEFEPVQTLLKSRSRTMIAPRIVSGPTLLTGICFCAPRGAAMTLRTGKGDRYNRKSFACGGSSATLVQHLVLHDGTAELKAAGYNFDHFDPLASNKRLESRSKPKAK